MPVIDFFRTRHTHSRGYGRELYFTPRKTIADIISGLVSLKSSLKERLWIDPCAADGRWADTAIGFGLKPNTIFGATLSEMYPSGTRIRLIRMNDDPNPIESGSLGTVEYVDDAGTIHMRWDNGRTLGLIYGMDQFEEVG